MPSTTIPVRTASAVYDVEIAPNLLGSLGERLAALLPSRPRMFVVTSPEIWALHGEAFAASLPSEPTVLYVPSG